VAESGVPVARDAHVGDDHGIVGQQVAQCVEELEGLWLLGFEASPGLGTAAG
jgi:hypothetical protein